MHGCMYTGLLLKYSFSFTIQGAQLKYSVFSESGRKPNIVCMQTYWSESEWSGRVQMNEPWFVLFWVDCRRAAGAEANGRSAAGALDEQCERETGRPHPAHTQTQTETGWDRTRNTRRGKHSRGGKHNDIVKAGLKTFFQKRNLTLGSGTVEQQGRLYSTEAAWNCAEELWGTGWWLQWHFTGRLDLLHQIFKSIQFKSLYFQSFLLQKSHTMNSKQNTHTNKTNSLEKESKSHHHLTCQICVDLCSVRTLIMHHSIYTQSVNAQSVHMSRHCLHWTDLYVSIIYHWDQTVISLAGWKIIHSSQTRAHCDILLQRRQ